MIAAGVGLSPKDSLRGWSVVAGAFIGLLISFGTLVVYSFGVLSSAMATEFHWGGLERGTLFASLSFAATVGGPVWGALADRWGGRRIALISATLLALGFFVLPAVPGNVVLIHIAFAVLGLLGSGTLPPTFASVIIGWFDRQRGLALGTSMIGVGLGAAVFPPLSAALVTQLGWRMTYVVFGVAILALVIPALLALLRPYPERHDGVRVASPAIRVLIGASLFQLRAVILILFALTSGAVLVTSVSDFVPMLQARGETMVAAARYQSVLGVSLVAGRLLIGGLIDRLFAPYVMLGVLLATSAGYFVLYAATTPFAYFLGAAGIGLAIGAEVDFLGYMISRYFDRATFTTIFAFLFALYALGGSVTPPLFGWLAQATGGYEVGILAFGVVTFLVALSMLALPAYAKHDATSPNASPH